MVWLLIFCMLVIGPSATAMKNALYGYDLLMHTDPYMPRMLLLNDQGDVVVDQLGTHELTWCVYTYLEKKEGKNSNILFGYGSKETNELNEVLLEIRVADKKSMTILKGKSNVEIDAVPPFNKWTMICIAWSGETGRLSFYFDGKEIKMVEDVRKGASIGKQGILSVGQDQDGFDSGYDPAQGVYGRVSQFNAWDRVLSTKEIQQVIDGKLYGNIVDWRTSSWALAGNVILLPTEAPNAALQQPTCKGDEDTVATDLTICLSFNGDSAAHETFTLFYYMNSYRTKELALVVNETRNIAAIVGIEERQLPHLTVSPGWQHWCFVWSNDMLDVYMNGGHYHTLEDFQQGTQMSADGDLYIQEENSRKRLKAQTSNVKLWERALSPSDVANEYNSQAEDNRPTKTYLIAAPLVAAQSTPYVRMYSQPRPATTYTYYHQ